MDPIQEVHILAQLVAVVDLEGGKPEQRYPMVIECKVPQNNQIKTNETSVVLWTSSLSP